MCPECGSTDIAIKQYDFGVCRETGYHDAGERFHCRACGATGDADDLRTTTAVETLGSFLAKNSGALRDGTISLASDMNCGRHLGSSGRHGAEAVQ
jgi:hypothetical protein